MVAVSGQGRDEMSSDGVFEWLQKVTYNWYCTGDITPFACQPMRQSGISSMRLCTAHMKDHQLQVVTGITGRAPPSDIERDLLALPSRLGGIGVVNPVKLSESEYLDSKSVTKPLSDLILEENSTYSFDAWDAQNRAKLEFYREKRQQLTIEATILKSTLPASLQHAMELAQEKGASSWLTALPVEEFGFALHKGAFHDALALRYGWPPTLQLSVLVVTLSQWSMLSLALREDFPPLGTMRYEISLQIYSQKYATVLLQNHIFNQSVVKFSLGHLPMWKMAHGWTY